MLSPKCISCGKFLADIQLPYESLKADIDSNSKLTNEEKKLAKKKILDDLQIKRWCCRSQVITYCDLINVII
jgi:DNA-directed RNA polymerase subunit N (RpoN/RPB10)